MISLVLPISFTRIGGVVVVLLLMGGWAASYKLGWAVGDLQRLSTDLRLPWQRDPTS
jgi:hypothetical protein